MPHRAFAPNPPSDSRRRKRDTTSDVDTSNSIYDPVSPDLAAPGFVADEVNSLVLHDKFD